MSGLPACNLSAPSFYSTKGRTPKPDGNRGERPAGCAGRSHRRGTSTHRAGCRQESTVVERQDPCAASGVIIAQNVTASAATGATLAGSPTAYHRRLSQVWIICDVYQNDLPLVELGDTAEIKLDGYSDRVLKGPSVTSVPCSTPALRTAKVRIQIANPQNILRLGMYVTATIRSKRSSKHAAVPSSAILHLHDRDWFTSLPVMGNFSA